ncbi:LON peptidase substrate-binding domain-containing protein [Hoyosella subflava]|uniref:ATP-dependent protease La domain family protein n=1 Tax=Hoyosella subflava (strain DSM 45089 / JCM 17490 / NBRC 109087 / DQS3-9A1) TaxID=443218 RepID=F6EN03_HOYSD|nr:LON peptidase substrate-binding domain-containing protein [Hoyosella subflava]AEF42895.1 ATP-dependent protease La domain family protein [Hoyosella subflava DQS3-9A1]
MTVSPMFPLGTALLPGGRLPLHVFEPRYQELVRDCLAAPEGPFFGEVLIARGAEVGGGDLRNEVGTRAEIVANVDLGGGRIAMDCRGRERIRVTRWLPDDPYPKAEVEPWPDEDQTIGESDFHAFSARIAELYSLLARLAGKQHVPSPRVPDLGGLPEDPALHLYSLADRVPLGDADRYALLAAPGLSTRVTVFSDALDGLVELAEFGLTK